MRFWEPSGSLGIWLVGVGLGSKDAHDVLGRQRDRDGWRLMALTPPLIPTSL